MNNVFLLFTYVVFSAYIIRTLRNILYLLFLWQLKEYRFDRIIAHLKTPIGKMLLVGKIAILKNSVMVAIIVGIAVLNITVSNGKFSLIHLSFWPFGFLILCFWLIWIFEALVNVRELMVKGWLKPKLTLKTLALLLPVLFLQFPFLSLGVWLFPPQLLLGILFDRLLGAEIMFFVLIYSLPVSLYKRWLIYRAGVKIGRMKNLKVIGITGSYGKTSTKEFLYTILKTKYSTAKTPDFTNTDIGIANFILQDLDPGTEVFVVEMGAYKRGEIGAICAMVRPEMGILTGINEQHIELFGSIESTKKAKFELFKSLPANSTAIFNGNNKECIDMAEGARKLNLNVRIYKTATDIKGTTIHKDHLDFSLVDDGTTQRMHLNLVGGQSLENVLGAIYGARYLGMNWDLVKKGVLMIEPPAKTMKIVSKKKGIFMVDDTFNSNPDGLLAAIRHMKLFKGRKILVMTPLIELGRESERIHEMLGKKAAEVCDSILLTNINFCASFMNGVKQTVNHTCTVEIVNTDLGVSIIRSVKNDDSVIVFEGKEAERILNRLL